MQQNNPQFSVLLFDPELVSAWLANAAQIGKSGPVCFQDGLVSYQTLVGLGSNASNVYAASFLPDPSWKGYPMLSQFRAQTAAEVKAGDSSASLAQGNDPLLVLEGWVAAEVVPQVGSDIKGRITRKNFLRAINKATVTFGSAEGRGAASDRLRKAEHDQAVLAPVQHFPVPEEVERGHEVVG